MCFYRLQLLVGMVIKIRFNVHYPFVVRGDRVFSAACNGADIPLNFSRHSVLPKHYRLWTWSQSPCVCISFRCLHVVCLVLGMPFLCFSYTNSRTCLSLTLSFACFGPQDAFGLRMLASWIVVFILSSIVLSALGHSVFMWWHSSWFLPHVIILH